VKILLVDNYDSFTWNLFHYLEQMVEHVDVIRNDDERCLATHLYDGVVISPGPGLPGESEYTTDVISRAAGTIPLLGICLGLQSIVMHYGGDLVNLSEVLHGKQRVTHIADRADPLFAGLGPEILTGHYHSWVADPDSMPSALTVTARDQEGHIMAARHLSQEVAGVQFHPESILTPEGFVMISNWIKTVSENHQKR
jgi:anthranilate synthase component II